MIVEESLLLILTPSGSTVWAQAEAVVSKAGSAADLYHWNGSDICAGRDDSEQSDVLAFDLGNYSLVLVNEEPPEKKLDELTVCIAEKFKGYKKFIAIHNLVAYIKRRPDLERIAEAVENFRHTPEYEEFTQALLVLIQGIGQNSRNTDALCKKVVEHLVSLKKKRIGRLSILKHSLAHIFMPIDIDLQGWSENYDAEYWEELQVVYRVKQREVEKQPLLEKFNEARRLLYKSEAALAADTIEKIFDENIGMLDEQQQISGREKWQLVQLLLPRSDPNDSVNGSGVNSVLYKKVSKIFNLLARGERDQLEAMLTESNPFHEWFCALDDALDELRVLLNVT